MLNMNEIKLLGYIINNGKYPKYENNPKDKWVDVRVLTKLFTYECVESCKEKGYIESDMANYDGAAESYKITDLGFVKNYNELHSGDTIDSGSGDSHSTATSGCSGHSGSCGMIDPEQERLIKYKVIYRKNRKKINMSGPFPATIKNNTRHK